MLSVFFSCLLALLHPFYVSLTELVHNAPDKTMEMSVRIFTDDLEEALRAAHPGQKIDVLHPQNRAQMQQWIDGYIKNHVQIGAGQSPLSFTCLGYEQQSESIWVHYESAPLYAKPPMLTVKNTILIKEHPEQVNLLRYKAAHQEKSYRLSLRETQTQLGF